MRLGLEMVGLEAALLSWGPDADRIVGRFEEDCGPVVAPDVAGTGFRVL